jgi:hypothetical protein
MDQSDGCRVRLRLMAAAAALALLGGFASAGASAQDASKESASATPEDGWKTDIFYENDTHRREGVGLSKFRNTIQIEADKKIGTVGDFNGVKFRSKLRGTWDGVYRLNSSEYGNKAGGPITLESTVPLPTNVALSPANILPPGNAIPHGEGVQVFNTGAVPLPGPILVPTPAGPMPLGGFLTPGFGLGVLANNPNDGLMVLGSRLHPTAGGVAFGVPVRPCDVDRRGCIAGYMDASRRELESPEFNDRLDFIREAYVTADMATANNKSWHFQVGKQQVVWGRTDLFRVLDVINPVDYSRNNIYDELQDIRIPMWIATAEYRMGASNTLDDSNLQFVWNFDKFRPNNLGQGGTPNQILDAGSFFRGMKNLWDNGGTVANFAGADPTGGAATTFGPNQIGIRQANMPEWALKNTQLGVKWEGVYKGTGFSLNALTYRSQLPSLHGGVPAVNGFFPAPGTNGGVPKVWPYLIAFDIEFPRVNMIGGSLDIQAESISSVFRVETALTRGEEFANTARPELYSMSRVWRYVIGWDRPTFIPFLNKNRTFLLSAQLFGQHLLDHEEFTGPWGKYGMPDWKHNHIGTFLIKGFYMNDRLSPQLIVAHDFKAKSTAWAPSLEWIATDNLKLTVGANIKSGNGAQTYNDCRDCNPWAPYTATPVHADPTVSGPVGLTGYEPLGRFRAGPIGMANKENEFFVTVRYKF